jgi:hypothetical protein
MKALHSGVVNWNSFECVMFAMERCGYLLVLRVFRCSLQMQGDSVVTVRQVENACRRFRRCDRDYNQIHDSSRVSPSTPTFGELGG